MYKILKLLINRKLDAHLKSHKDKISSFDDPMAKEIQWGAIRKGSFGYRNRKLSKTAENDFVFRPTITAILFPMVFIGMGVLMIYNLTHLQFSFFNAIFYPVNTLRIIIHQFQGMNSERLYGFLFGLVFFLAGLILLIISIKPIIFCSKQRVFISGFSFLKQQKVTFDDIYAIQIISDSGNDSDSPMIYELNLVLKSKQRVHVLGHPGKEAILKDASKLSAFLSVPLWDMS